MYLCRPDTFERTRTHLTRAKPTRTPVYSARPFEMEVAVYTCNSCMIQCRTSDLQRYHMKTEWHRYNLKRRVAQLPPISADVFAEKVQVSERESMLNQVDEFGFPVLKPREPHNHSKKRMLASKKRKARGRPFNATDDLVARSGSPASSIASSVSKLSFASSNEIHTDFDADRASEFGFTSDSHLDYNTSDYSNSESEYTVDESTEWTVCDCIFCGRSNGGVEANVRHMFGSHGLYIPERSYLKDIEKFLTFLGDLILTDKNCLCCSFTGSSVESIRAHIISKRHARIPYETKEERLRFAEFYDFSSLKDNSSAPSKNQICKEVKFAPDDDAAQSYSEGDSTLSSENQVGDFESPEAEAVSNYSSAQVNDAGVELTLPTGSRVGHRSMRRYYRQNYPLPADDRDGNRTLAAADRRFWGGVQERQIRFGEKKAQQLERRAMNNEIKNQAKRGNFKEHYRDELLQ
ncbi:LAMI_0A02608g1_1 [Lachancea mirantina]|uniref:LAMI_0A02608g1_1 n=1 Tax=Lachancea mirantina TaxID=1230905 RepID=A0A1G4IMP0_9SACH|nr:LAMI_0A02608g1_1 [Lachancea mirantina]